MAKGQHFSSYQKGIVKRFYEHRETLSTQKLGELVSELYLERDRRKLDRLWAKVETALEGAGVDKARIARVVSRQNLQELAALVGELF
ncbi:MAG TPA: hypothetical protein PK280_04170 [Planctomycetota bacterium]|nr:hypothetical protein [Planctomycetota bacterium]